MQEVELKYKIAEPIASSVIDFVKSMHNISLVHLGPIEEQSNRDLYFDTISRNLSAITASLRVRYEQEKNLVITLKTQDTDDHQDENTTIDEALFLREEIEGKPDVEILKKIHTKLSALAIVKTEYDPLALAAIGVTGLFGSWGLTELFYLENNRLSRSLLDSDGAKLGKLVLDRVRFSGNKD